MPATTFTVPHDLTREEAAARLLAGVPKLESLIPGGGSVKAERDNNRGGYAGSDHALLRADFYLD